MLWLFLYIIYYTYFNVGWIASINVLFSHHFLGWFVCWNRSAYTALAHNVSINVLSPRLYLIIVNKMRQLLILISVHKYIIVSSITHSISFSFSPFANGLRVLGCALKAFYKQCRHKAIHLSWSLICSDWYEYVYCSFESKSGLTDFELFAMKFVKNSANRILAQMVCCHNLSPFFFLVWDSVKSLNGCRNECCQVWLFYYEILMIRLK